MFPSILEVNLRSTTGMADCNHLDRIEHLDHTRVAHRAKLSKGVSGEGQETPAGSDVEGKDAAVGAIFLHLVLAIACMTGVASRGAACPPGAVV